MDAVEVKLWVVLGACAVGGAVISFLLYRLITDIDATQAEHTRAISDLKVDVAKAHSGNEALTEHLRLLRHDVREMKAGIDVYFQKIMDLIGRGK